MQNLAAKTKYGKSIEGVLFTQTKMVATDSFRLLEVKKNINVSEEVILKSKGFKGEQSVTVSPEGMIFDGSKILKSDKIDGNFPDYESIIPKDTPLGTLKMNAKLLGELLMTVAKHIDKIGSVEISVFGPNKPLLITANNIMALCMPMNK